MISNPNLHTNLDFSIVLLHIQINSITACSDWIRHELWAGSMKPDLFLTGNCVIELTNEIDCGVLGINMHFKRSDNKWSAMMHHHCIQMRLFWSLVFGSRPNLSSLFCHTLRHICSSKTIWINEQLLRKNERKQMKNNVDVNYDFDLNLCVLVQCSKVWTPCFCVFFLVCFLTMVVVCLFFWLNAVNHKSIHTMKEIQPNPFLTNVESGKLKNN